MKKTITVLMVLLCVLSLAAQKPLGNLKGIVTDSAGAQPLADATISVLRIKDSALISFTVTARNGSFEIRNLEPGNYQMIASYTGLQSLTKKFNITETQLQVNLGSIQMSRNYKALDAIVITDMAPVKIIQDTIEFRASAFKSSKPNAVVEDLLKKIPGVEVDKDGNVKSQGEQVQKVYVDGKEFFGTDPKLATKNLTQDMVESIQVYDDMSEQAKFTKIDDGSRQKAINIKLKKDKKNGIFGKASVGMGTNGRFDESLSMNKFQGSRQLSLIGAANNVNKQGFSFSDVVGSMGGFNGAGGGGGMNMLGGGGGGQVRISGGPVGMSSGAGSANSTGIITPLSGGVNYRDQWGSKIDIASSLFYSHTNTVTAQNRLRQNYFPNDSTTRDSSDNSSNNTNQNVRFNLRMEYKLDSMNSILYYPSFTLQQSENHSLDSTLTTASKSGAPFYKALSSQNQNDNTRNGYNMNQNLLLRHRFGKLGRTITLGITSTLNHSNGKGFTYEPYHYYQPDGSMYLSHLFDQESNSVVDGFNNTLSVSYTEPISRNKILELNYAYTNNETTSDRKTYDMNTASGKYDQLNTLLTNYFRNDYIVNRAGLNFRVQQKKYNYQLGMGIQNSELVSRSIRAASQKDTTLKQSFVNFYPTANFNYNFARSKNLRFSYRGRTNQPSITQLQDVPDYSNPLQVRTGNPLLKQEFQNNLNLSYNTFNVISFKFFVANLNFSQTSDKIVNSIDSLSKGVTIIRPVNMNGAYNASGFITFGLPFKNPKLKGSNVNTTTNINYSKDVSMFYGQPNYTKTLSITQSASINYTYKELLDVSLRGSFAYNDTRYALQSGSNATYYTQIYSTDFTYSFLHNLVLETDFNYFINTGRAQGFNQSVPMWNASVSRLFFKNKAGQLKLAVNDILNQNKSLTASTGENYVEYDRSVVLQRYFMLSFTYNLNRMGGKNMLQQVPRNFQRGMRNMRSGE